MSHQVQEVAAHYTEGRQGQNRPELSGTQGIQSPQQLVTEHLNLWTSTVTHKSSSGRGRGNGKSSKIELTGIKKLRELILELAVRGKLVAQNPDDEPASKLLERIEEEKAQLIKDGKLKKQKPLASVTDDEKPFELPDGWEWCRVGNLLDLLNGYAFKSSEFTKSGIKLLRNINVSHGNLDWGETAYISNSRVSEFNQFTLKEDDLVLTLDRPLIATGLKWARIKADDLPCLLLQRVAKFEFHGNSLNSNFLSNWLNSSFFISNIDPGRSNGVPHISTKQVKELIFSLPPLAEQQRIVAKVDELMALCDQLEQQSEHQLSAHQQLTDTLLATLTESANAQELNDNWQRLTQHFDLLFSGPMGAWAIDRLKDTILQLAVMGKLVPQNPEDEPASKLLERIEEEKARLVKEGKIKKPKKLSQVSDEEKPFKLPQGWEWVRLGNALEVINGRAYKKHEMLSSGTPLLRVGNLFTSNEWYYSDLELEPNKYIDNGDLIYAWSASFGPFIWDGGKVIYHYHIWKLEIFDEKSLYKPFAYNYLKAITEQIKASGSGIAMLHMTKERMEKLVIPLPPLAEQQRIVAKVDQLFALCDQLKKQLQQASETEQYLTNAIVEQALN